jgi:hypothetical protein
MAHVAACTLCFVSKLRYSYVPLVYVRSDNFISCRSENCKRKDREYRSGRRAGCLVRVIQERIKKNIEKAVNGRTRDLRCDTIDPPTPAHARHRH